MAYYNRYQLNIGSANEIARGEGFKRSFDAFDDKVGEVGLGIAKKYLERNGDFMLPVDMKYITVPVVTVEEIMGIGARIGDNTVITVDELEGPGEPKRGVVRWVAHHREVCPGKGARVSYWWKRIR